MLPQPGRYTVTAPERTVYESKGGALVFAAKCLINEQTAITAYQALVQKDGTLGERTIKTLREIFGWDGVDPMWLQDTDLGAVQFDITVEEELDDQGKPRARVTWMDPVGRANGGGLPKGDRNAILAKYGAKFRAVAGGKPMASRPAAPKVQPALPPAAPKPTPAPAAPSQPPLAPVAGATLEAAWNALCAAPGAPADRNLLVVKWHALVAEVAGDRPQDALTPEDWAKIAAAAETAWDNIPY